MNYKGKSSDYLLRLIGAGFVLKTKDWDGGLLRGLDKGDDKRSRGNYCRGRKVNKSSSGTSSSN